MVKFGVVRGPSSDHSGLGSTPKLNFSVIVTPACAADMETEVLVARSHQNVVFLRLWGRFPYVVAGCFFRYLLYLAQQTTQRLLPVAEHSGGVVVADKLQAEFIYEHVEGAKAVAGTGVRYVGIHDDVGAVGGPDEKLHEEPVRPAVVASRLVQACDLVVLVDGSHVPETRGKVKSTQRQNIHAKLYEMKPGCSSGETEGAFCRAWA